MLKNKLPIMKIEEEIKQKVPFKSVVEKTIVNIHFSSNRFKTIENSYFKGFGITTKQYNILRILRGADGPLSTSQIRSRMLDKMSDASRMVDRLEKKDLIEKKDCEKDNRLVDVYITSSGLELLEKIDLGNITSQLKHDLTTEDLENLNDLLDRFRCLNT